MKTLGVIGAAAAVLFAGAATADPAVMFNGGSGALPAGTTVFEDFEGYNSGDPLVGGVNAFAFDGTDGSGAKPAYGSEGNYGSVLAGGTYNVTFGPANVFAFVLGSLDTYNTLTLFFSDGTSLDYMGGQIINGLSFPSGDQISGESNGVVSFSAGGGPKIIGATFQSSQNSFEFDNLSIGAVPEPATWALMILGFGAIGGAMRRRSATKTAVRFA